MSPQPVQLEKMFTLIRERRRFTLGMPLCRNTATPLALLTPEGVSMLVSQGIEVVVERGIGKAIRYEDDRYCQAGASIASRTETFGCDVVLYSGNILAEEAVCIRPHGLLLNLRDNFALHRDATQILLDRMVTVLSLCQVRDNRGLMPLADILEEVSGRATVVAATSFLSSPLIGKGLLPGGVAGVNPCEVVILGTGMAALAAARSVIGLGGMVRMFDSDPYCLRTAISELGPAVIGSALHPVVLGHALSSADIVIATRLYRHFAIDDSVLNTMKRGVIIFDLDDKNGISSTFPTLNCIDVAMAMENRIEPSPAVCLVNPVGAVKRTAAMALTNDIVPVIGRLFGSGEGLVNVLKTDSGLRAAVALYKGRIVSRELAKSLNTKWVDINLLLSFS